MVILARVYIVRHGETDANRARIIQGHLDTSLNETGFHQAALVAGALREINFDLALSSDLKRATATAAAILEHQPSLKLHMVKELRERFMGELQGQVYGKHKLQNGNSALEMVDAFSNRAMDWWMGAIVGHTAALPLREEPYNILVVSHGGFIGTLVKHLIQSGRVISDGVMHGFSLPNASVSVVEWDGKAWRLVKYGDVSCLSAGHLDHNADEIRI